MDNRQPQKPKVELDYTVRRKIIYKGQMAPKGHVFLVLKLKHKKVEACKLIQRGQSPELEEEICRVIRKQIKERYHL